MCYNLNICSTLVAEIPMRELSIREMREKLGNLDRLVQHEGEILITRRVFPLHACYP